MKKLSIAILQLEDTIFSIMKDGIVTNMFGKIVLSSMKIIPFANPDSVIKYSSTIWSFTK